MADLLLNVVMIPEFGASGAALGTMIAEIVVWIVQFYFMKTDVKGIYREIRYGLLIGAAVVGSVLSFLVKRQNWNVFIMLVVSSCLYFGGYILILYFANDSLTVEVKNKIVSILKKKQETDI